MSDTPETDAEIKIEMITACYPNEYVSGDFARNLERERDEAREEIDDIRKMLSESGEAIGNGVHDFSIIEMVKNIIQSKNYFIQKSDSAERERDEAREALKKCREDSICYAEHMRRCGYVAAYKESTENADIATIILNQLKEGGE
jgi:hypothetical protein